MERTFVTREIFTISEVLSPNECRQLVEQAQLAGLQEQQYGQRTAAEVRRRAAVDDEATARMLWGRIAFMIPPLEELYHPPLVPDPPIAVALSAYRPIGLNTRLRYYHYQPGERFPPHFDFAHEQDAMVRSFLTYILYLNDGYRGGETRFGEVAISPRSGMALLFPHELRHEGCEILEGWKTVLRSDVMYQRLEEA